MKRIKLFENFLVNEGSDQVTYYVGKFEDKMSGVGPGEAAGWIDGITELKDEDKRSIWNKIQKFIDEKKKTTDPTELPKWVNESEVSEAKLTDAAQEFISKKIAKLKEEGKDDEQASAIAYSMARKEGYDVPENSNEGLDNPADMASNSNKFSKEEKIIQELVYFIHEHLVEGEKGESTVVGDTIEVDYKGHIYKITVSK